MKHSSTEERIVWSRYRRSHYWARLVDLDDVNACVRSWKRAFVYEKRVNVHRLQPSISSIWQWWASCNSSEDTSAEGSLRSWNSMWPGDHYAGSMVLSSRVTIRRRTFPERYGDACHCSWCIPSLYVLPLHMNQLNHCLKREQDENRSKGMKKELQSSGNWVLARSPWLLWNKQVEAKRELVAEMAAKRNTL